MGKMTQYFDYLTRKPSDFYPEIVYGPYSHITITPEMKVVRRKLKWYKKQDTFSQGELF